MCSRYRGINELSRRPRHFRRHGSLSQQCRVPRLCWDTTRRDGWQRGWSRSWSQGWSQNPRTPVVVYGRYDSFISEKPYGNQRPALTSAGRGCLRSQRSWVRIPPGVLCVTASPADRYLSAGLLFFSSAASVLSLRLSQFHLPNKTRISLEAGEVSTGAGCACFYHAY